MFFMRSIEGQNFSSERAIAALESQFLDIRARRINNEVWEELAFEFIKQKRDNKKFPVTFSKCPGGPYAGN